MGTHISRTRTQFLVEAKLKKMAQAAAQGPCLLELCPIRSSAGLPSKEKENLIE